MSVLTLGLVTALVSDAASQVPASADTAWRAGDTERAERLYAELLAADSTHATALHRLALLRSWSERYDESLAIFDRLLRHHPTHTSARVDRARVLAWQGRMDAASAVYDSILARHPDDAGARAGRAQVLLWSGQGAAAGDAYLRLLELDPDNMDALRGLARVAAWGGSPEEAERRWREALEREPYDLESLVGLSQALRWQGREPRALEVARTAVELAPGHADARTELRWARAAVGPEIRPVVTRESDSDANRISTAAVAVRYRIAAPLELRLDAYVREAIDLNPGAPTFRHDARGGSLGANVRVGAGWAVSASLGATASDRATDPEPAYAVGVVTPPGRWIRAGAAFRRHAFDATNQLIEREVTLNESSAEARLTLTDQTAVDLSAGLGRLRGGVSGMENRRWRARISASHRPGRTLTIAAAASGFGYRADLNDGYFDPAFFGLAELPVRWEPVIGPVTLRLEVAPGIQQVGSGGDPAAAGRGVGGLTWRIGIGRELVLSTLVANAGMDRLSPEADSDYTYRAFTARLSWTF